MVARAKGNRTSVELGAVGVLAWLVAAAPIAAQSVRVTLQAPPDFYTCERATPLPPTAPGGFGPALDAKIAHECGDPTDLRSGRVMVFAVGNRNAPIAAGQNVLQRVEVRLDQYQVDPTTGKCDQRVPRAFSITEYFTHQNGAPALDHHVGAECCELLVKERVRIRTAILPLPAGARPPVPGFGGVGRPYTTAAQLDAVNRSIAANATARWGFRYEYDNCNTPKETRSGTTHYLRLRLDYPGGPSGASTWFE